MCCQVIKQRKAKDHSCQLPKVNRQCVTCQNIRVESVNYQNWCKSYFETTLRKPNNFTSDWNSVKLNTRLKHHFVIRSVVSIYLLHQSTLILLLIKKPKMPAWIRKNLNAAEFFFNGGMLVTKMIKVGTLLTNS